MRLRVVGRPDGLDSPGACQPIVAAGIKVGRAAECDLVLDDVLRLVSRHHAWLAPQGDGTALLRCISTSAMLRVNGEPLIPGAERLVHDGDCIRIGGFDILVEIAEHAPAPLPMPVTQAAASSATSRRPASMPSSSAPSTAPAEAKPRARRLDHWFDLETVADPLGPGSPLPALAEAAQPTFSPVSTVPNPPAMPAFESSLSRVVLRSSQPSSPASAVSAATGPVAAPREPAAALAAERKLIDAASAGGAPGELRAAFLRGAGLDGDTPFNIDAASMEHLGALMRASTEGTLALLRSRRVAKRSIRAEGTQIVARQNNPLKFAPDAAQALILLLSLQSPRGFLDPVDALRDAHNDLQVHQLAMVAGMRAAVFDLISRLGPEVTEAAEGPAHGLAQSIPALRAAALWRRHQQDHERMLENLDDVFEVAFGREFLKAYETQSKLGASAPPPLDE
jgi:type VI secretion system FHA domain protein